MRAVISIVVVFVLAVAGGCQCDDGIQKVPPRLGLDEDGLDFGPVAIGERAEERIRLRARTVTDLVLSVRVEDDGPFTLAQQPPAFVPGNGFVDLVLSFAPPDADTFAGTLIVETDDPDQPTRRLLLSGQGLRPQIEVTPSDLSLEATICPEDGASDRCSDTAKVTVKNAGEVVLRLGAIELAPGDDAAELPPGLTLDRTYAASVLPPGGSVEVTVRWQPVTAGVGEHAAVLVIPSSDVDAPLVEVPIAARAQPNLPPEACIRVQNVTRRELRGGGQYATVIVDEEEYVDPQTPGTLHVQPSMTLNVTALPCSFDPEGDSLTYSWSVTRPAQSRASPSQPLRADTSVEIDSAGEYVLTLTVRDGLGQEGTASVNLSAVPRDGVLVQLSWQDDEAWSQADLDLHLIYEPGDLFCVRDCFFDNFAPEWQSGEQFLRPRLLRDDQGTAGRLESIRLPEAPPDGVFRVAVHYYQGPGNLAVTPRIDLTVEGEVLDSIRPSTPMTSSGDAWFAARITYVDGVPSVAALQDRDSREYGGTVSVVCGP